MNNEGKFRFRMSCEIMLRWLFSPSKITRSIAAQQREVVTRLFSYMSCDDDAEAVFVKSKIAETTFVDGSVSVVWLSDDFIAPLIAVMAVSFAKLLSSSGEVPFCPVLKQSSNGFFGYHLEDIELKNQTKEQLFYFHLCVCAATKLIIMKKDAIYDALEGCNEFVNTHLNCN